jgi:hypothetical protein
MENPLPGRPKLPPHRLGGAEWIDGPLCCSYERNSATLGQCVRAGDGWDGYDMTTQNAAQTGPFCLGHFRELAKAKDAIEEFFTVCE